MEILDLSKRLRKYIKRHNIESCFNKQQSILKINPFHPSLNVEILEPRHFKIYSFRITRKYRAIFIYCGASTIEIIDISNHYK